MRIDYNRNIRHRRGVVLSPQTEVTYRIRNEVHCLGEESPWQGRQLPSDLRKALVEEKRDSL